MTDWPLMSSKWVRERAARGGKELDIVAKETDELTCVQCPREEYCTDSEGRVHRDTKSRARG